MAEKVHNARLQRGEIEASSEIEFYEDYFIRKGKNVSITANYSEITRCIENDTNFYLEYPNQNMVINLQKNRCDLELINFIRTTFKIENHIWVFWCWLPIPVLSIILGFKYKNAGFKCTKNIVGGFIIGFLMLIYGSFCLMPTFEQDYNKMMHIKIILMHLFQIMENLKFKIGEPILMKIKQITQSLMFITIRKM